MTDWKAQTFNLEHKFKSLDAYYASVTGELARRNGVLQRCLPVAHDALSAVLAAQTLEDAQTAASNAVARMRELLEEGAPK